MVSSRKGASSLCVPGLEPEQAESPVMAVLAVLLECFDHGTPRAPFPAVGSPG